MPTTRITWRDVLLMPEDGKRYEAIDGELYVTPAPWRRHQRLVLLFARALYQALEEPGHGEVYFAPFGVEFPETEEGVQPDLLFVSKERLHIVGEDWIRDAPDLVIEILSPTTASRDRGIKRKLYERQGVAHYWMVDPETEEVLAWNFAAGAKEPERYRDRLPVRLGDRVMGEIDLREIFRKSRRT